VKPVERPAASPRGRAAAAGKSRKTKSGNIQHRSALAATDANVLREEMQALRQLVEAHSQWMAEHDRRIETHDQSDTLTKAEAEQLRAEMAECRREMQVREERITRQAIALQQLLDAFSADYLITAKEMNVSRRHIVTAVIVAQIILAENSETIDRLLDRLQDLYHPGTRSKTPRIHYAIVWYEEMVKAGYPADEIEDLAARFLQRTGRPHEEASARHTALKRIRESASSATRPADADVTLPNRANK
jgi:hypothetical protein